MVCDYAIGISEEHMEMMRVAIKIFFRGKECTIGEAERTLIGEEVDRRLAETPAKNSSAPKLERFITRSTIYMKMNKSEYLRSIGWDPYQRDNRV